MEDHDGATYGWEPARMACIGSKDGNLRTLAARTGWGSDSIWCLYVDEQGVLWVGACRGGLSRLQNGHFITWTTKNGLINNVICQILEDARGNLWLGSYGGVFRINKQELNQSASEPNREVHCVGYGLEDGLPSLECQGGFQPSGLQIARWRLWFPTIKGLVVVNPETSQQEFLPPSSGHRRCHRGRTYSNPETDWQIRRQRWLVRQRQVFLRATNASSFNTRL
jgi:hypothetical protein